MYHMSQETRLCWVVPTKEHGRKVLFYIYNKKDILYDRLLFSCRESA